MELVEYFRFALALCFVLGLIGACGFAAKRFGLTARPGAPGNKDRLAIVEVRAIDAKRKLLLIRRDDVQHLLLLGGQQDLLIEANIRRAEDSGQKTDSGKDPSRIIAFSGGINL